MAKAAATRGDLSWNLRLLVILSCLGSLLSDDDTHSLSCNSIARIRPTPEELSFEKQCLMDGEPFPHKEENATKECVDLFQKLKDISEELRKERLNMESVANKTRNYTVQIKMECHYKQGQITDACLNITIDEQSFLNFNPKNKKWGVIYDKDRGIMEKLERNRDLAQDLATFSMGDSRHCLKEFLKPRKEMPRSTSRAPDTTQLPSASQLQPTMDTTQSLPNKDTTQKTPNTMSLKEEIIVPIVIIVIVMFLLLIGGILVKRICKKVPPAAPLPL